MSEGHAKYSPSGAKKWMTCPGSIAMEHGKADGGNEYSDEGTAAHALAAMCLEGDKHPVAFIGRVLDIVDGVYAPDYDGATTPEVTTVRSFHVDADMAAHVNEYVQSIKEFAEGNDAFYEVKLPISHITGEEGATGTGDAVIIADGGDEVQVHDLKYGQGVKVKAERNPQLMIYALGAIAEYAPVFGEPKRVRVVIHQPRKGGTDEWDCTIEELREFEAECKKAAALARTAFEFRANWIGKDDSYLVAGEHCKSSFCKARGVCPRQDRWVEESVGADFEVLAADVSNAPLPVPEELAQLGKKLLCIDAIQDWCKQVRAKAEAALFEHNNTPEVQQALGFKLVQGKKGNRQWDDVGAVTELLKKMRFKNEDIFDMTLMSAPALEKTIGKDHPKRWVKLIEHITQKDGQPSVASIDDKREALVLTPAVDDFAAEDGSDLA